jgi:class 3 adenylate cyclase/tetratricopeptide (TPR) repeat protein
VSEIKDTTALCCNLVWGAAAAEDAEVVHSLLSRFLQLAREETDRFGGTLNQVLGQGFLALFGAPVAHEDHAPRAVLTAAALRQRIGQLEEEVETRYGVRWAVRMGLDAGPVVTGGGSGTAVGEAIELARRLLEAARPGDVLLSNRLAGRVRSRFQLTEERDVGGDGPQPGASVWRLLDAAPSFAAPRRFRGWRLSPFVGRAREMTLLEELRRQAEAGQGQVVGIAGEPGSGKSRLLYELSTALRDLPVSYLRGQCVSYASGIPYFPFVDTVRQASHIGESDGPPTVAAKLRASLEAVGLPPDELLPYFLRLLGLRQGAEPLDSIEPQAIKAQTFNAMRQMVLAASRRGLVVMELEDLHWIDETSEEFLTSLVEEIAGARLLLLLTYRSGYHPRWLQKTFATQITMRRLSADESTAIVVSILGQHEAAQRSGRIVKKAEGNPFFLEELARAVTDDPGEESESRIPGTVQGVLMARIDRLPEPHKRLLQIGSVLDRELSLQLLQKVWDRPEPLAELLADLQRWEFIYTAPSEETAASYSFRHALAQDVAYQSLLKGHRRALHARVAEALEMLYDGRQEDVYDRLTYHYPRAGDSEKTVHYLVLFAERAAHHFAHAEAAKALRQALTHAERLPEEVRDRRQIEVLLELAESLLPLARFPETLELCLAHEAALERVGDRSLEARFRFWLAHTYTYLGHQEETRRQAERAIGAAQACGDEATEGKAWYVLGRNAFWAGDFAAGLEQSQRAVVLLERSGEPWWQGQAHWVAGFHHWALGQFDQALQALQRASDIGEALDDYRLDASWSIGFVQASLGNWQAGIEQCLRGIERSRDPLNTAVATGFLGYAYLQKGDHGSAIQALRESMERLAEAGMRQLLGWLAVFLGEAYLAAGRLEEAREATAEALQVSQEAHFDYGAGLARRALGQIAMAAGERDEARQQLDQALETFRAMNAPFEVARTRLALAAGRSGRATEAGGGDLAEAHRLFRELGASAYALQAEAVAEDLGLDTPSVGSP